MGNVPKDTLIEEALIAKDALSRQVDTKIWRTRLRIQELILKSNPYLKSNNCIFNQKLFLSVILGGVFWWTIISLDGKQVENSWERFEEAEIEPVLYFDLLRLDWNALSASLVERIYQKWIVQWKNIEQINSEINIISQFQVTQLQEQMRTVWLVESNVFYRLIHEVNNKNDTSLPQLPAYV